MKGLKKALLWFLLVVFGLTNMSMFNCTFAQWSSSNVYTEVLSSTLKNPSLRSALIGSEVTDKTWADIVNQQVINLIGYAIDVFIAIWIAIAFFGGYTIMFSNKEDAYQEWIKILYYGIIWIIIMVSAKFIAWWLVWSDGAIYRNWMYLGSADKPSWIYLAHNIYEKILYPFIKIALYLVVGILFFMMVGKVVTFTMSTDDIAKKKAWWIILWTAIWMFVMLWAKQMVEAVYWTQEKVLN